MRICLDGQAMTDRSVLALGMFDGVHVGHQVLLKRAKALATRQRIPLAVCTFTEHPMRLIHPEKCPPMLTTPEERAQRMEALGVDILCAEPFDEQRMRTAPEEYIAQLCRRFHPVVVVAGYNYTFGRNGEGNPALLHALGEIFGFSAQVVPQITLDGQEVSSTVIRGLLSKGQVRIVRDMLGVPYERLAKMTWRAGEGYDVRMISNGKQDVPKGTYWVTLDDGVKQYPATLLVKREGMGFASLPEVLAPGEVVKTRFYRQAGSPE